MPNRLLQSVYSILQNHHTSTFLNSKKQEKAGNNNLHMYKLFLTGDSLDSKIEEARFETTYYQN